ncbi:MAG TPA: recombinase family protein [Acidocella sp.]|jgi:DNA invertase Pin-like site-specific DNA recombinase|uniref:recombinase family protein n=1 Tax=Acidocella sp. TaxID=50710 RepID=UPI002C10FDA4|nr:recombinase family protein [Acidocella sp.]HVE22542.1 recombinase family protein [Acidocella sp.]
MTGRYVSYLRVSTERQGRSGLGLEAQRAAVAAFLKDGAVLLGEVIEVESGKRSDRPKLAEALLSCQRTGATLLIAKLDRLSRDAHFLLGLQRAGTAFRALDIPSADNFSVGLMALMAQRERELISERTKAALAAAKARGVAMGGFRGHLPDGRLGAAANADAARDYAALVGPMIKAGIEAGQSLRQVAAQMVAAGIRTPRGGQWSAAAVRSVWLRLQATAGTLNEAEGRQRWTGRAV